MKQWLIEPGSKVKLKDFDPGAHGKHVSHHDATSEIEKNLELMDTLQDLLYAEGKHSLLIVLQGLDAGGKDGVVRHVIRGMNPQGCSITGFKQPSREELARSDPSSTSGTIGMVTKGAIMAATKSSFEVEAVTFPMMPVNNVCNRNWKTQDLEPSTWARFYRVEIRRNFVNQGDEVTARVRFRENGSRCSCAQAVVFLSEWRRTRLNWDFEPYSSATGINQV